MKPVGWLGQDADRHEHCYPSHKTIEASRDVLVEGYGAVRAGDAVGKHKGSCSKHSTPHGAKVQKGSASVFVNGKPMAREGDPVKCDTGQTAPLLRGRPTVVAGDASPYAAASKVAGEPAPRPVPDEPGAPKALTTQGSDAARIAEIRRILSYSAVGRDANETLEKNGVSIRFAEGVGTYHDPATNQITLERSHSNARLALSLVHEAHHSRVFHSENPVYTRPLMFSREDFAHRMIREEAMAQVLANKTADQLAEALPPDLAALFQLPLRPDVQTEVYWRGRQRARNAWISDHPKASEGDMNRAGDAGALEELYREIRSARTSTTNQEYGEFYNRIWDAAQRIEWGTTINGIIK